MDELNKTVINIQPAQAFMLMVEHSENEKLARPGLNLAFSAHLMDMGKVAEEDLLKKARVRAGAI